MRAVLARTVLLLLPVALGCGGGDPPVDPEIPVLTTVDITRDTATLFTTPPGTSVTLVALGRDQDGVEMPGLAPAEFTSGTSTWFYTGSNYFDFGDNENLHLRFSIAGSILSMSLWRVAVVNGVATETPIPVNGTSNTITARHCGCTK